MNKNIAARGLLLTLAAFALMVCTLPFPAARAAFGLTSDSTYYTVDTGAGLVFKVRRTDTGSSTQSAGDIASLKYNNVEYQDTSRGSQVNSGFDYLYSGVSAVTVDAAVVNTNYIKVTVQAGNLTHYYMARKGYANIYMGTYFTTEPDTLGLCRYIVRIPSTLLTNGPTPSDIRNNTGAIESADIFGLANGETRSKHYSNQRLMDWAYIGATGTNVGVWMVRDYNEGNSGGPFYRSLLNQCGDDQEITYIVNYGEGQTEAFRTGILNSYTLTFTTGAAPALPIDTSWFSGMGLTGFVDTTGRGRVTGVGIQGRDTNYTYTVGFSNSAAQYFTTARTSDGNFGSGYMLPGTYTMTIYKGELAVYTASVDVTAGGVNALHTVTITGDPSSTVPVWRIGDWDGAPQELLNGDKITTMHPSDVRMDTWNPGPYVVGTSLPALGFPCYQWKDVNGTQNVQFNLTKVPTDTRTVRIGITTAYSGARPKISLNNWNSSLPAPSTQPTSRTLTVGTYRGNNTTYSFTVPASAFVAGTNTLYISPISGSGGTGFLSPGYSVDCVDMTAPPTSVAGSVSLQGRTAMNQPLVFTLTPTGGTLGSVSTQTLTPAADGTFSLSGVPAGTYTLSVKGTQWLRQSATLDTSGGSVSGVKLVLPSGDVNNDNQVSNTDYLILRAAYGTAAGQTGFDARADLNGDGQISNTDYLILRGNYGKVGS